MVRLNVFWVSTHSFRVLLLSWILLGVLPGGSFLEAEDGVGRYALLVGVGSYEQWTPLANPITDVRALAVELRHRYGFLPEILENPSREQVVAKLRRYLGKTYGPSDQLIVVFAGHGTYDEVSRIGYLVASDSANRKRDPNFVTLLNYPWLLTLIDNIDCPNILLVVDACFSGSLQSIDADRPRTSTKSSMDGWVRQFLTAGGKEYVPDGDPDRHTPFMRNLLEGLRSPVRNQSLKLRELFSDFMLTAEPTPRWGSFGRHSGLGQFTFTASGSAPSPLPPRGQSAGSRSTLLPSSTTQALSAPRLRMEATRLSDRAIERAFERLEIFDTTRNPEGDFPNQYRLQTRGQWDVVVDLESELMWQQAGSEYRMDHDEALAFIQRLNKKAHAGYRDWRLPTVEELASLLEPQRQASGLYVSIRFDPEQETCWSVDRDAPGTHAYYVSFNAGRAILGFGARRAFVRAVRSN